MDTPTTADLGRAACGLAMRLAVAERRGVEGEGCARRAARGDRARDLCVF